MHANVFIFHLHNTTAPSLFFPPLSLSLRNSQSRRRLWLWPELSGRPCWLHDDAETSTKTHKTGSHPEPVEIHKEQHKLAGTLNATHVCVLEWWSPGQRQGMAATRVKKKVHRHFLMVSLWSRPEKSLAEALIRAVKPASWEGKRQGGE